MAVEFNMRSEHLYGRGTGLEWGKKFKHRIINGYPYFRSPISGLTPFSDNQTAIRLDRITGWTKFEKNLKNYKRHWTFQ
jgi:hypothetical protein